MNDGTKLTSLKIPAIVTACGFALQVLPSMIAGASLATITMAWLGVALALIGIIWLVMAFIERRRQIKEAERIASHRYNLRHRSDDSLRTHNQQPRQGVPRLRNKD